MSIGIPGLDNEWEVVHDPVSTESRGVERYDVPDEWEVLHDPAPPAGIPGGAMTGDWVPNSDPIVPPVSLFRKPAQELQAAPQAASVPSPLMTGDANDSLSRTGKIPIGGIGQASLLPNEYSTGHSEGDPNVPTGLKFDPRTVLQTAAQRNKDDAAKDRLEWMSNQAKNFRFAEQNYDPVRMAEMYSTVFPGEAFNQEFFDRLVGAYRKAHYALSSVGSSPERLLSGSVAPEDRELTLNAVGDIGNEPRYREQSTSTLGRMGETVLRSMERAGYTGQEIINKAFDLAGRQKPFNELTNDEAAFLTKLGAARDKVDPLERNGALLTVVQKALGMAPDVIASSGLAKTATGLAETAAKSPEAVQFLSSLAGAGWFGANEFQDAKAANMAEGMTENNATWAALGSSAATTFFFTHLPWLQKAAPEIQSTAMRNIADKIAAMPRSISKGVMAMRAAEVVSGELKEALKHAQGLVKTGDYGGVVANAIDPSRFVQDSAVLGLISAPQLAHDFSKAVASQPKWQQPSVSKLVGRISDAISARKNAPDPGAQEYARMYDSALRESEQIQVDRRQMSAEQGVALGEHIKRQQKLFQRSGMAADVSPQTTVDWALNHPEEANKVAAAGSYYPGVLDHPDLTVPMQDGRSADNTRANILDWITQTARAPEEHRNLLRALADGESIPDGWQQIPSGTPPVIHPSVEIAQTPWGNFYRFRRNGPGSPVEPTTPAPQAAPVSPTVKESTSGKEESNQGKIEETPPQGAGNRNPGSDASGSGGQGAVPTSDAGNGTANAPAPDDGTAAGSNAPRLAYGDPAGNVAPGETATGAPGVGPGSEQAGSGGGAEKQPWEMMRGEYAASPWSEQASGQAYGPMSGRDILDAFDKYGAKGGSHYIAVKTALEAGKPVPAEVLAEYPELTKTDTPSPTAPETPGPKRIGEKAPSVPQDEASGESESKPDGKQPTQQQPKELTYDEFKTEYHRLFNEMMKYGPDQIGSKEFADRMAELSDRYPDWADRVENEREAPKAGEGAPPPARDYGDVNTPNRVALGEHFGEQLSGGKSYPSIREAREEAAGLLKGPVNPGTPAAKHVDEAVEIGVVRAARKIVQETKDPKEAFDKLVDLYQRQPNLGVRTSTSMQQQAYSTPAPLAYLASQLASAHGRSVYDSSAGNGMLLMQGNATANELNPDRAAALKALGIETTTNDATGFRPNKTFDSVIINPPFGKVRDGQGREQVWNVDGVPTNQIDHAIALNTLPTMNQDGRAVLILGAKGGDAFGQPLVRARAYSGSGKKFYDKLYDQYNVVDHFTVDGNLYARQGAKFPVDVVVIDGKGTSTRPRPWDVKHGGLPKVYDSWEALRDGKLADQQQAASSMVPSGPTNGGVSGSAPGLRPDADLGPVPQPAPVPRPLDGEGGGQSSPGIRQPVVGEGGAPSESGPIGSGGKAPNDGRNDGLPGADVQSSPKAVPAGGVERPASGGDDRGSIGSAGLDNPPAPRSRVVKERETEYQIHYPPKSNHESVDTLLPKTHSQAVAHSLDSVAAAHGNIDQFVQRELGYLNRDSEAFQKHYSAEQVDALGLAIHNHKKGSGFIIGDQTGVGKGRVVAGMIRYAKQQGDIPAFVTEKPNLFADLVRDLTDIGMNDPSSLFQFIATNDMTGNNKIPLPDGRILSSTSKKNAKLLAEAIANWESGKGLVANVDGEDVKYDAIFTTYSQLQPVGGKQSERHELLRRIAKSAYFILDESHNAGGTAQADRSGKVLDKTGRAGFVRSLISEAPGVFYSSATFAKRPSVMDLYSRTDMAKAVGSPEKLIEAITKGGVPLQQVVSEMLTEAGQYLRRERSYDGIEFGTKTVPVDLEKADKIAEIFRAIYKLDKIKKNSADDMNEDVVSAGGKLGNDNSTGQAGIDGGQAFSSILWNLVDQMLASLKADVAADEAIASFNKGKGKSPFLVMDNTMESALDRYVDEVGALPGAKLDFNYRDLLKHYLERSRDVIIHDGKGGAVRRPLTDAELGDDGLAAYDAARDLIDNLEINAPASPIDWIRHRLEKAGLRVAEITGRKRMVQYDGGGGQVLIERPDGEVGTSGKIATINAYNRGDIDVILANRSGATGISAHAAKGFKNLKQRHMIVVQAAKNIDEFMQMLGRVNRTGQVNKPQYTLLLTDVPAENRPASVLTKKLASLNANVTGSSSGNVGFESPDIMNQVGDIIVARYMMDNPSLHAEIGNPLGDHGPPKTEDAARIVSGRMSLLPVETQREFWDEISRQFNHEIAELDSRGENPLVAKTMPLEAKTKERLQIFAGNEESANPFEQPAHLERVSAKVQGQAFPSAEVSDMVKKFYDTDSLSDLWKVRRDWVRAKQEELRTAIRDYAVKMVENLNDADTADRMRMFNDQLALVSNAMSDFAPGTPVAYTTMDGPIDGVVTRITRQGKAKNPLAPSSWIIDVALADPLRKASIPMSRLMNNSDLLVSDGELLHRRLEQFDNVGSSSREERWIATGNLLAAFDTLKDQKGRIVFFTDDTGANRRGVLMPKTFDGSKWQEERPVTFEKADHAVQFLSQRGTLFTPDHTLSVRMAGGNLVLQAPKARSKGGKFTTNPDLLAATSPAEFVSRGQVMELSVPEARAKKVVDKLLGLTSLQADVDRDLARQIVGTAAPAKSPKKSNDMRGPNAGPPASDMRRVGKKNPNPVATKVAEDVLDPLHGVGPGNFTMGSTVRFNADKKRRVAQVDKAFFAAKLAVDKLSEADRNEIVDRWERGVAQKTPELEQAVQMWKEIWDRTANEVNRESDGKFLDPGERIEHYFGRHYKGPDVAASVLRDIINTGRKIGSSRFGGKPSSLKQRTFEFDSDVRRVRERLLQDAQAAKEAGDKAQYKELTKKAKALEPVSDNPFRLQEMKYDELTNFLRDMKIKNDLRDHGLLKMSRGLKAEPGYIIPRGKNGPLPMYTIYGPRTIEVPEGVNAELFNGIVDQLARMGVDYERKFAIGGGALSRSLGGKVVQRYFTPADAAAHELGHEIDKAYPIRDALFMDKVGRDELRALADARANGIEGAKDNKAFQSYIRETPEKTAVALQAFMAAPDMMRKIAPKTYERLRQFLGSYQELKPILDIKPGVAIDELNSSVPVAGTRIMGYWSVPEASGRVIEKFASTGLHEWMREQGLGGKAASVAMKAIGGTARKMMQGALSLSAFHPTATILMSVESDLASMLHGLMTGEGTTALYGAGRLAGAPLTVGYRQYIAMRQRGLYAAMDSDITDSQRKELRKYLLGGAEMQQRPMAEEYRKMREAFAKMQRPDGGLLKRTAWAGKALLHSPLALLEAATTPVMKFAGNLKIGAELDMQAEIDRRLGPDAPIERRIEEYRRASQDVDARFGQVRWDNLFMNKWAKDLVQFAFMAPGWTGGNVAIPVGAVKDVVESLSRAKAGQPWITWRMASVPATVMVLGAAGAMYQYLRTGKWPEDMQDYFEPRDGGTNPDGTPSRVSFPSSVKDWSGYTVAPFTTLAHKMNPAIAWALQVAQNRDYWQREITSKKYGETPEEKLKRIALDETKFFLSKMVPMSIQGYRQRAETGATIGKQAESFMGITTPPADHTRSRAHQATLDMLEERGGFTTTKEEGQRLDTKRKIINATRTTGKADQPERKMFSDAENKRMNATAGLSPLSSAFRHLTVEQKIEVFRKYATPAEKAELAPLVVESARNLIHAAQKHPSPESRDRAARVRRLYAEIEPDLSAPKRIGIKK